MTEFSAVDLSAEEGMQWQAVDSSQISEIGYESGAEYPLGIKFSPNKKQQAAGEPGSEYHYKNADYDLFNALVASPSIGTYFVKNIKSRPDLYPFVKVEADPTAPTAEPHSETNYAPVVGNDDTPSPGTALALIDSMDDDLLFTPGKITDAQLAMMRSDWLTEAKKYDISIEKARTELKRFARPLQKLRTGIEARAKKLTGATKRKIAAIDSEKRRLVHIVGGIEQEVLSPLTAWEQEEETRKARLAGIVTRLAAIGTAFYTCTETVTAAISELESFDLSTMQEYKVGAESAIAASLRVLKPELERRKVAEANEAELARLRAEAAERAEQDRLAEQKRQEDARVTAAAEALAAKKVEAVIEEVKQTTRQEVVAELAAANHNDPASDSNQGHGEPEEVQPFVYPEIPSAKEEIDPKEHHREVWFEARKAFIQHLGLNTEDANEILQLIADGLIPHVTITY